MLPISTDGYILDHLYFTLAILILIRTRGVSPLFFTTSNLAAIRGQERLPEVLPKLNLTCCNLQVHYLRVKPLERTTLL